MTASMDHPHIVTFIGVAWDSLSDLCVVLEFMDGGDLRTLLNKYEATKHPVGFDKQKTTIALHVCHALTYLHSLMPPVIHRDLKSRNILLNHDFEAKLTDFGISRERLDQTMTAGVGTSLWMAPEVMLGEKYDVKADMFSFGVVLSELDVHTLPYAQAKQRSLDTSGRKMADATLLQKITAGEIQVSRERLDQTMTAGVGTSLWMAPEVMLGEKYDVKADMFSFGVVLSELDVHTLPYAQAKQRSLDTSGRKMADATLLQKITAGEIQVDFSESSPRSLVDLGLACVAIDSTDRPTAAEALYRLQVILTQDLG
ncbi:TKL protein kinase [Phytophthora palmivora]|uniref:TKL protein kinase n=1 Tax=Phytophthora palmivora TaxID=4796 RepID=A0A2P4YK73_9STRA|nr:TKL protein kinase [Phytophthora palmivora]